MLFKSVLLATIIACAQARFGQEQIPIPAIQAVTSGGAPGEAATIAGAAISDLLAGANACAKLQRGDQILAQLGNGADAVKAAIGMVAAEKNFNPFAQDIPTICSDPTLPSSAVLRGITPLIDPAVGGSDLANQLSAESVKNPFNADGLSVADVLVAQGFSNFTTQDLNGNTGTPSNAGGAADQGASTTATPASSSVAAAAVSSNKACSIAAADASPISASSTVTVVVTETVTPTTAATAAAATSSAASSNSNVQQSSIAGLDFGLCVPTMKFEGGLGGRPATEFTFQAIDPLVAKGQQEALNPNIITNRICDQLTNVCEANQAAKDACQTAKAQIEALGTRDKSTADAWNTALGFKGTVTNPDGGAAEPPASTASAARLRRAVAFAA